MKNKISFGLFILCWAALEGRLHASAPSNPLRLTREESSQVISKIGEMGKGQSALADPRLSEAKLFLSSLGITPESVSAGCELGLGAIESGADSASLPLNIVREFQTANEILATANPDIQDMARRIFLSSGNASILGSKEKSQLQILKSSAETKSTPNKLKFSYRRGSFFNRWPIDKRLNRATLDRLISDTLIGLSPYGIRPADIELSFLMLEHRPRRSVFAVDSSPRLGTFGNQNADISLTISPPNRAQGRTIKLDFEAIYVGVLGGIEKTIATLSVAALTHRQLLKDPANFEAEVNAFRYHLWKLYRLSAKETQATLLPIIKWAELASKGANKKNLGEAFYAYVVAKKLFVELSQLELRRLAQEAQTQVAAGSTAGANPAIRFVTRPQLVGGTGVHAGKSSNSGYYYASNCGGRTCDHAAASYDPFFYYYYPWYFGYWNSVFPTVSPSPLFYHLEDQRFHSQNYWADTNPLSPDHFVQPIIPTFHASDETPISEAWDPGSSHGQPAANLWPRVSNDGSEFDAGGLLDELYPDETTGGGSFGGLSVSSTGSSQDHTPATTGGYFTTGTGSEPATTGGFFTTGTGSEPATTGHHHTTGTGVESTTGGWTTTTGYDATTTTGYDATTTTGYDSTTTTGGDSTGTGGNW